MNWSETVSRTRTTHGTRDRAIRYSPNFVRDSHTSRKRRTTALRSRENTLSSRIKREITHFRLSDNTSLFTPPNLPSSQHYRKLFSNGWALSALSTGGARARRRRRASLTLTGVYLFVVVQFTINFRSDDTIMRGNSLPIRPT
jgi:transglutaminase/protease-like cytokinesis protein 3